MPELPEVEVTRLSFVNRIAGAKVLSLHMGKPLRWPLGCAPQGLAGRTVRGVRRRGKYLLIDLDRGLLLLHLGMSGSLSFAAHMPAAGVHDHFDLVTTKGTLRLNDPRRFGAVVYAESEDASEAVKLLGRLGVEPLSDDFDVDRFHAGLKRRKAAIKQVLLAGNVVVGVGNIYACESLFRAGINPKTAAGKISRARYDKLAEAIRDILAAAIVQGGSTLRDFIAVNGQSGYFQQTYFVYDRAGVPCRNCSAPVRQIKQGQRSTFYCAVCQR